MFDWKSWLELAVGVVIALVSAGVASFVTSVILRQVAKSREWPGVLRGRARHPFRLLLIVIAMWIAVHFTLPKTVPVKPIDHGFLIATIVVGTWFTSALVSFGIGIAMGRYRTDIPDNRLRRRLRTQLIVVRRLASVVIVIIGIASILLTFPGVQAVGASVLASAGIVSIVAGLAAQSTLANVFAGVQLVFSDAIRVDDVVIAQNEWGRIEEITLTYVVVHIWDDRRLVLPSTYFTSTPFENWTRHSSELLGSVEFDLDWRVSPTQMRERLDAILADTHLWDGRTGVLQVTDAVGGFVRIRILVTAVDAPTLFDLRCHVREEMVEWLHTKDPAALPRTRIQTVDRESRPRPGAAPETSTDKIGLFTGTLAAQQRARLFTGTVPVADPDNP
jgi:small-conductance mechanosensitive channel